MISPPRRSVTRFFIPLIDVLILLFCIFLLMPFVSSPAADDPGTKPEAKAPELPSDVQELRRQLAAAQKDRDEARNRLDRFQKERGSGVIYHVLEVVPSSLLPGGRKEDGYLLAFVPERLEIRTQAKADEYVALQKQRAGEKDVFFLLRPPVNRTAGSADLPQPLSREDRTRYEAWFKGVPHRYESN